jgi:hypothetical protein
LTKNNGAVGAKRARVAGYVVVGSLGKAEIGRAVQRSLLEGIVYDLLLRYAGGRFTPKFDVHGLGPQTQSKSSRITSSSFFLVELFFPPWLLEIQ